MPVTMLSLFLLLAGLFSLSAVAGATAELKAKLFSRDPDIERNPLKYYLGYRGNDFDTRWAKYFNDTPITLSQEFSAGLELSPVPANQGTLFKDAPAALDRQGYLPLENGYSFLDDGTLQLAIRVDVPSSFTGEMYDFWFSWHVNDTTKYKLWNPGQHQYAAVKSSQIANDSQKPSYRDRYWNLTSFVDEYIGNMALKLSIGFFDPRLLHFSLSTPTTGVQTIVTAFVRLLVYTEEKPAQMAQKGFTADDVVLAHQVRRKPDGSGMEIRSRFWFGQGALALLRLVGMQDSVAHDLSVHCFNEMSHLGTFLPALFAEFKNDIPT